MAVFRLERVEEACAFGRTPRRNARPAAPEDRIRRLDLRLTKIFRITERVRLQANLDAYNAFNSSAIQSVQTTFGPNWLVPLTILDARLFQVSGQLTF